VSVSSSTSRIVYAGNNSLVTAYAVPFYFEENAHLNAIAKTAAGVETVVTLTNHTGAGNENGGTVRTAVAVPATSTLTIYREVPFTQATSYEENDAFPAASHERALDKLTTITQQLERRITNCIRGTEATPLSPIPSPTGTQQFVLSAASNQPPSWQELPVLAAGPVVATGSTQARFISDRFADVVNVKDFGAVGDGVADDTAAIQAAVDSLTNGGTVGLPCGTYKVSSAITISTPGIIIAGQNRTKSVIKTNSTTANVVVLDAGNVGLSNLRIEHTATRTAGASISITTNASKVYVQQVDIDAPFIGISIPSIAIARFEAVDINNAVATTGKSVVVTGGFAVHFVDCIFRNPQGARPACHVELQHVEDVVFSGCQMISGGVNLNVIPGAGQAVGLVWCNDTQFDDASTASIRLAPATGGVVNEVTISSPWIKGTAHDILATTAGGGTISSLQVSNSLLVGTGEGVTSSGASNLLITGNKIGGHTTAISLTNTSGAVITGNILGAHGLYSGNSVAVYLGGTTSSAIVANNDIRSNVVGVSDVSSNSAFNIFHYNAGVGGSVIPNTIPSADWGIDFAKRSGVSVGASPYALGVGSGLVLLHHNGSGGLAMFLAYAGTVTKVSGAANIVSGAAALNQIGLAYNSGPGKYEVSNGYATPQDVFIATLKTRSAS
jgi:hypothetical protein